MTSSSAAPEAPLLVLGARRTLAEYLGDIWERRHFAMALATTDLRVRHLNSVLGQLWHLLNPALMITVYYFIFGVVLEARRGVDYYVTFLVTGVMTFRLAQTIITGCAGSIPKNLGLIRSIQFPRALIPISISIQNVVGFLPGFSLVLVVGLAEGAPLSWRLLFLPAVVVVTAVFSLGAGFGAARLGSSYSDFLQVLPHAFRVLFYMSGVLFSIQNSIANETIRMILSLNPFYGLIELARWCVLGTELHLSGTVAAAVWTLVAVTSGLAFFRAAEYRYGA